MHAALACRPQVLWTCQQVACQFLSALTRAHNKQNALDAATSTPPSSLSFERGGVDAPEHFQKTWWGRLLLTVSLYNHKKNQLGIGGFTAYRAAVEQAESPALYVALGLEEDQFMARYHMLSQHVWLVIRRLRREGDHPDAMYFKQRFYDTFQADVERRVYHAGIQLQLGRWLKKLEGIFYASSIAYDRALDGESDESLESALLRNVFDNDKTKEQSCQRLAHYIKRELACLDLTPTQEVYRGQIRFTQLLQPDDK